MFLKKLLGKGAFSATSRGPVATALTQAKEAATAKAAQAKEAAMAKAAQAKEAAMAKAAQAKQSSAARATPVTPRQAGPMGSIAVALKGRRLMKKGGAVKKSSDAMGRAVKRKTADVKGRAMKKGK